MQVAYKLLISDESTYEKLTSEEQKLWTQFETDDIYQFLTGEPDMIPEFHYNWFIVQRITVDITNNQAPPVPATALAPQVPPGPPVPLHTPPSSSSSNSSTSTPHSSPTPSRSGTRPLRQHPL